MHVFESSPLPPFIPLPTSQSNHFSYYTRKIDLLIQLGMKEFKNSEIGRFWLSLHGYRAWLAYEDLEKVQVC